MSDCAVNFDRVLDLAGAICDQRASQDDFVELDSIVAADEAARRFYCGYCWVHITLGMEGRVHRALSQVRERDHLTLAALAPWESEALTLTVPSGVFLASATPTFPATLFRSTIGYFSSGWPLSYLITTVIFAIGALIGSLVTVSHPTHPTHVAEQSTAVPSPLFPLPSVVGRITGMVDCRWGDPQTKAINGADVPLGRKYDLTAGLMEITYDTGAKVILQGPVTYEVEAKNGGFMSVGKLTGKVTTGSAKGFSVRTPTAVVTDLGTEFGVEVSQVGLTRVHVLEGVVEAKTDGADSGVRHRQRVTEGHAVEVGRQGERINAVAFAPESFTRKVQRVVDTPVEAAYINAVLADRPMGYWPLNEPPDSRRFLDRSGHGFHGFAMNKVLAGQPGPQSGSSRALALDGAGYVDVGLHNEFALVNDFTVEAWVCMDRIAPQPYGRIIAVNPGTGEDISRMFGWALEASRAEPQDTQSPGGEICFCTYGVRDYRFAVPREMLSDGRWLHVAVVCDRTNAAHLYLDGEHRQAIAAEKSGNRGGPVWVEIGGGMRSEFWRGRLAHVAVYPQALTREKIRNHYQQWGKPNGADGK